jgi:uncharacterized protein YbjQ (UPF0145 family)
MSVFTSELSVSEFVLVRDAGFTPLGITIGTSVYYVGFQPPRVGNCELEEISQAIYAARALAMTRLEEEADQLGADGVVGVRLELGRHQWGEDMAEFIAVGTAVRSSDEQPSRAPSGRPFTSDLSGQDFWTLLRSGHRPVGLVMGSCVYHVGRRGIVQNAEQLGRNVEMTDYSQGLSEARELAIGRMQAEAEQVQAAGIVGVQIHEHNHSWGPQTVEFLAIGTAVIPAQDAGGIAAPTPVISFDS